MSAQPIDYTALAKQAGAVSSQTSSAPASVKSDTSSASIDYDALAKQAGATNSTPAQKSTSLDWSQVVHNLPSSFVNLLKNVSAGLGPTSASPDFSKPPSGRFSQSNPDTANRFPMIASAADSLEDLVHNVTHPQEFFEKDPAGAVQTFGNLAAGGLKSLGSIPALADVSETASEAAKGAASGAGRGLTGMTTVRRLGIPIKVPDVALSAGVGGGLASASHIIPPEIGGIVGAAAPVVYKAYQGAKEALAALATKRAAVASARSALQDAQQSAADAIKGGYEYQSPEYRGTGSPLPTEEQDLGKTALAENQVIPPERQLAAPSGPPPIIAGPITPTPIENPPPVAETAPSAAATPSAAPVQATAAPDASAPAQSGNEGELVSRDEISKSIYGKPFGSIEPVPGQTVAQRQSVVQAAYDDIHAGRTVTKIGDFTAAPKPETTTTAAPTPQAEAISEPDQESSMAPVSRGTESVSEDSQPETESTTPAPTSRVVNLPSASGFGPAKIITEEGLSKYAQDNGVTEDQGRQMLQGDGYQIIGRSGLNRALHGIGTELDMDHDMLSDVAKIQFRVKSMSQLSQEDMLQLYQDLQEKRAVNNPMLGKGELADKFQGRSSAPETAYTSQPQVGPPAPTAPVRQPRGFDELNAQMTESLRNRAPQSVAPAQALKAALEQSPESSTIGQGKTNGIGQGSAGATAEGASATKPIPSSFNASSPAATEVLIPGEGRSFPAKYSVKELNDIQASHGGLTFQPNPKYSLTNDRDYKSADNQGKVVQGALPGQFKPAFHITDNPDATNGPPLIDSQGNVIGGNGRTMTLQRVYQYNPAGAQAYKDLLTQKAGQFGIDPTQIAGMKRPVLVRQISDQDLGNSQNAVTDFNKTGTAELRPAERSIADSRRVSQSTLDDIGGKLQDAGADSTLTDVLKGKSGSEVLNKLIDDGVISPQERAKYASGDTLTPDGQQRISKLLVGRFFRDPAQIDTIPTTIKNKIERIAAPLASLEDKGEWSLTPQVQQGLDLLEDARAHGGGKNLDMFVKQNSLLSAQSYSPEAIAMAKTLQAMPQRQLVSAIAHYVEDAAHYSQGPDLFGTAPKSPAESLAEALSYAKQ